jgi:hypothetical protein
MANTGVPSSSGGGGGTATIPIVNRAALVTTTQAKKGDMAVTQGGTTFRLAALPATTLANWTFLSRKIVIYNAAIAYDTFELVRLNATSPVYEKADLAVAGTPLTNEISWRPYAPGFVGKDGNLIPNSDGSRGVSYGWPATAVPIATDTVLNKGVFQLTGALQLVSTVEGIWVDPSVPHDFRIRAYSSTLGATGTDRRFNVDLRPYDIDDNLIDVQKVAIKVGTLGRLLQPLTPGVTTVIELNLTDLGGVNNWETSGAATVGNRAVSVFNYLDSRGQKYSADPNDPNREPYTRNRVNGAYTNASSFVIDGPGNRLLITLAAAWTGTAASVGDWVGNGQDGLSYPFMTNSYVLGATEVKFFMRQHGLDRTGGVSTVGAVQGSSKFWAGTRRVRPTVQGNTNAGSTNVTRWTDIELIAGNQEILVRGDEDLNQFSQMVAAAKALKGIIRGRDADTRIALPFTAALDNDGVLMQNLTVQNTNLAFTGFMFSANGGTNSTVNAAFAGMAKSKLVTLPASHGLKVGDWASVKSTLNWNPARATYLAGDIFQIMALLPANVAVISRALRFTYGGANPVGLLEKRAFSSTRFQNCRIVQNGDDSAQGVELRNQKGKFSDGLIIEGAGQTAVRTWDCIGDFHGLEIAGGNDQLVVTTHYGLSINDLSLVTIHAPKLSGGRHALASGGDYPCEWVMVGGDVGGGHENVQASVDAHGGVWSAKLLGVNVDGQVYSSAFLTEVNGGTITTGFGGITAANVTDVDTLPPSILWGNEIPAGASFKSNGTKIISAGSASNVIHCANNGLTAPIGESFVMTDFEMTCDPTASPGGLGATSTAPFRVQTIMKYLRLQGRISSKAKWNDPSTVFADNVYESDIDIVATQCAFSYTNENLGATNSRAGNTHRLKGIFTDGGRAGSTDAATVDASFLALRQHELIFDVKSNRSKGPGVQVSQASRLELVARTRNSGLTAVAAASRTGVRIDDVPDVILRDLEPDEPSIPNGLRVTNVASLRSRNSWLTGGVSPFVFTGVTLSIDDNVHYRTGAGPWNTSSSVPSQTLNVTQSAHAFVVGDWLRFNGTAWVLAQANSSVNADVIGVVSTVSGVNDFTITTSGLLTTAGLTVGSQFLSEFTAGTLTIIDPAIAAVPGTVSVPVGIAISATQMIVGIKRGQEL